MFLDIGEEVQSQGQSIPQISDHDHDGIHSKRPHPSNWIRFFYSAIEIDNGSVSGTCTIDWSRGNVQYVTMTGNTTFTFVKPTSGMRCILHVAGAYTPTWPSSVRWPTGVTPTATATSGKKDIYSFIYSGKELLYDGVQSANFAIT